MMVGNRARAWQWCLRVPAGRGETARQALIAAGTLDRSLVPRREGDDLLLPLTGPQDGVEWQEFDALPGRVELPRHELVGGIAVMQENDPAGAARVLASRKSLHTVLFSRSGVEGEYRTKRFTVLAGEETTRTVVVEHGCRFLVDLSAAYFSARLATERRRVAKEARAGECVLDMFAGVGPFAIAIAKGASLVVAADINPQAVELMIANCANNRVHNVLPVLADARRLPGLLPWKFDRIIMNLPKAGESFLEGAFLLCRPGGTIHFYALVSAEGVHGPLIGRLGGQVVAERAVRSYSPAQWHAVYDIRVG